MSKKKNNMSNMNVKGNGNNITVGSQKINKSNQNNITKYIVDDKFKEEHHWYAPIDPEGLLYKRLPNKNDRPMLEKYYNELLIPGTTKTKPIVFNAVVIAQRKDDKFVLINVVDEFGNLMSPHVIVKSDDIDLSPALRRVIRFEGTIYQYLGNNNDPYSECKYGIEIVSEQVRVLTTKQHEYTNSIWNTLFNENKTYTSGKELFDRYNNELEMEDRLFLLNNVQEYLSQMSIYMFKVPNMIAPTAMNMYLMRDDIYDVETIQTCHKSLNKLLTILTDYLIQINPKSYTQTLQIITYVTLTFMGIDFNKPNDMDKFNETINKLNVAKSNAKYYIKNAKENAGGVHEILNTIPEGLHVSPTQMHEMAEYQFSKRILFWC
jgi:hypothetical protein